MMKAADDPGGNLDGIRFRWQREAHLFRRGHSLRKRPVWRLNKTREDQIARGGARDSVNAWNEWPRACTAIVTSRRERPYDRMQAGGDEVDELKAFHGFRVGELAVFWSRVRRFQDSSLHEDLLN